MTIPDSVTSVGSSAFYNCSGLTSVTIPNSVTSIGDYAFYGCSGLTNIAIPESVTSIGSSAFYGCSGITSVTIPTSICSRKMSDVFPDLYTTITNVIISASVTNIGASAFSGCTGLTSVTIPDSVTSIGNRAFQGCSGLTSVTIPDSVTSIGGDAFNGCSRLTSVTIPDSVTSIGGQAFYGCSGLTSVTIPDSVTSIGYSAFIFCSSLSSFVVGAGNANYKSVNGLLLSKDGMSLIAGVNGDVTIPDGVTSIRENAFRDRTGLTSVTIPNSVSSIGDYAFSGCGSLASATIPDSVTSIGSGAFFGCNESLYDTQTIAGVRLVDGWAVGYTDTLSGDLDLTGVRGFGYSAFSGCSGLTSVTIPDSVTSIGSRAFSGCSGLTNVIIPDGVTRIGDYTFYNCSDLTSVTIPDSVTSIGNRAFYGCNESLYDTQTIAGVRLVDGWAVGYTDTLSGDLDLTGVRGFGYSAFSGCSGLTSVTIGNGVTSIEYDTFHGCSRLTSVTIPDSVTSIGGDAFYGCRGLTSITIPDSVTSIGYYAFYGCSGLTSVTIPDSVTSIGNSAFSGCTGLTSVSIPQFVCSSRVCDVFTSSYQSITNIVIGGEVVSINTSIFDSCTDLKQVSAPISLIDNVVEAINKSLLSEVRIVCSDVQTGGDGLWSIDIENHHSGCSSWRSGSILDDQESWLEMDVEKHGQLSFCWKSSSESDGDWVFDYCYLSIDGKMKGELITENDAYALDGVAIGGKTGWQNVVFDIEGAGPHKIRWTYKKDEVDEGDVGSDCVWLDDIEFVERSVLSFDLAGGTGTTPESISELRGTIVHLPAQDGFSRIDYIFGGWSDGKNIYAGGYDYVVTAADVVFTALWTKKTFLTFDLGGGSGLAPDVVKELGGTVVELPNQSGFLREDHVFDGWSDGKRIYASGTRYTMPTSDVTLTAQWTKKTFLTFDLGGGSGSVPEVIKELGGTVVVLPEQVAFAWEDHIFNGWSDELNIYAGGANYLMPASDVTLTAQWTKKTFLTFDLGEGAGSVPEVIKELGGAVVVLPGQVGFERVDYVFDGWSDGFKIYAGGDDYTVTATDVVFTAQWTKKTFLSFDLGGGSGLAPDAVKELGGTVVVLPGQVGFAWEDHVFNGWSDGSNVYAGGANYTMPSSDVRLTAQWIAKRFLTFTLSGGEGEIPITIKDIPNTIVKLPSVEGFSKSKHTFVGWSDGTKIYLPREDYQVTDSNVEFSAVWRRNEIEVSISAGIVENGGTIDVGGATVSIAAETSPSSSNEPAIYYTLDGTMPTTDSLRYNDPFEVTVTSVTVKAFAVLDNYFDSNVAEFSFTRLPYSLGECLDSPESVFSTDEDVGWGRVLGEASHDGVAALRSGAIGDNQSTWVEMQVDGAGEISFWSKISSQNKVRTNKHDYLSISVDGDESVALGGGDIGWTNMVVAVEGVGEHAVRWTYVKDNDGTSDREDCAWLDEITWTRKEMVDGIDWRFRTRNGEAVLGGDAALAAVPVTAVGDIDIPDELGGCPVTRIESGAFAGCDGITGIALPGSVTMVADGVFAECPRLERIVLKNCMMDVNIAGVGDEVSIQRIHDSVESITARPPTCTEDGWTHEVMCSRCKEVFEVSEVLAKFGHIETETKSAQPPTCTKDGWTHEVICSRCNEILEASTILTKLGHQIGEGVVTKEATKTTEGEMTYYCTRCGEILKTELINMLTAATFNIDEDGVLLGVDLNGETEIGIPSSVTSIGDYAFSGSGSLASVTIPDSVTSIGERAFLGCSGLMSIVVDENNPNYKSENGLLLSKDGKKLVRGVNGDVTIPAGVRSIEDFAFSGCSGLTRVLIPYGVTYIGESAFSGCSGLVNLTIPHSVGAIWRGAFSGCTGLKSVTMGWKVTSSEVGAMRILNYAFSGCYRLESITFAGMAPAVTYNTFSGVASGCVVRILRAASGFTFDSDGKWWGMIVEYYDPPSGPTVVVDVKMEEPVLNAESGKRTIEPKSGETLDESDVAKVKMTAVDGATDITAAYHVELVDGTIEITLATPKVEEVEEAKKDEDDPSGMLAYVEPELIEDKPTPDVEKGEEVGALPVKTYPGLYYKAAWGDDLGGMTEGNKVQATGDSLYLGVIKQKGPKGFYRLTVSEQ